MAVSYAQISDISSILKKIIVPVIQDQIPKESILYNKIKKNSGVTISNDNIYISTRYGRHSGIYAVAEGTEPRTGKATYGNPYTAVKYTFGSLELSDQAIEAASNANKKAIASILATEVKALKDDIRKDINRQFWGKGTGELCLANGTGSQTTTLTVDSPGARYLAPGMWIQIGTSAVTQVSTIVSNTVTVTTSTAWADNAVVRKENASGSSNAEMMGIKGLVDTGAYVTTIQNIDRTANAYVCSQILDAAGAATISEANMITLYLDCKEYGDPNAFFVGPYGFARYGQLLTGLRSTASLKEVLAGGWKGLEFMDIGVVLDYDCPEISQASCQGYFLDFDSFTIAQMAEPFKWLEADAHGGILKRSASDRTRWEGTLKFYGNLVCLKFQGNGCYNTFNA